MDLIFSKPLEFKWAGKSRTALMSRVASILALATTCAVGDASGR